MTRTRRILTWTAGVLGVATVAMAALHTPIGMRLLRGGGGGTCPFGMDGAALAPAVRDEHRRIAVERLRGDVLVSARPAGDFTLGATTRAEVRTWAAAQGSECRPGRDQRGLQCDAAGDARASFYLDFDQRDVLVGAMWMTYSRKAEDASARLAAARAALQGAVGAPTRDVGEVDAAYLAARPLRQARSEYRRANYYAALSATNMGPSGYLVSQVYQSMD